MCQLGMPKKFAPLSKKNGIPIARNINVLISFQNKNHVVILNTSRSYKFPVVIYIYIGIPRCLLLVVFSSLLPKEG